MSEGHYPIPDIDGRQAIRMFSSTERRTARAAPRKSGHSVKMRARC